ncbi:MAG: RluA family pseudouridine synthase, partial [Oscillospiraceae bacterium]|nr:RluA family pseudouridine synthase [Oscillospiraceae bacterium]
KLITGRTHQIRAQLAYIGFPIVGDDKYGSKRINKELKAKHQALCSYKLVFSFKTDAGKLEYLKDREFAVVE